MTKRKGSYPNNDLEGELEKALLKLKENKAKEKGPIIRADARKI